MSDDRCEGCHSRSGRISLTYRGVFELAAGQAVPRGPGALVDLGGAGQGRRGWRLEPDVHARAGLWCVDCHLHTDVMGDGEARLHQEDQVEVTCEACHGPVDPEGESTWDQVADPVTRDLLRLRNETRPGGERVRLGRRGTPLWNLRPVAPGRGWSLIRKGDAKVVLVPPTPVDMDHGRRGHERLTCGACHAARAPLCRSCHVSFEAAGEQWDFSAGRVTPGRWVERVERTVGFGWRPPALGVRADGKIVPVIPGMVMTLDDGTSPSVRSLARRLYAPIAPHGTLGRARTCVSCHRPSSPGDLFGSLRPSPWQGTRTGLRPFDAGERHRTLNASLAP